VGAAETLEDFPVYQRATQAMSVVTLVRGWVLARRGEAKSAPEVSSKRGKPMLDVSAIALLLRQRERVTQLVAHRHRPDRTRKHGLV